MSSPTARSLSYLREQGYVCDVVERKIPGTFITKDFLGLFDILGVHPAIPGVLGVQTTSASNQASRRIKVQKNGHLSTWFAAGNRAHIHGWKKGGKRGTRKLWQVNILDVTP
jgi:hypothetical protein